MTSSLQKQQRVFLILLQIIFWMAKLWSLHHELERNFPKETSLWHGFTLFKSLAWQMIAVYACVGFLFRRFYPRKKYFVYGLLCIATLIICTAMSSLIQVAFMVLHSPTFKLRWIFVAIAAFGQLIDIAILVSVFIVARLVLYYYQKDQRAKRIEKERIETELTFLKAQINPHFLFNALNSIYVLMKEDVAQAEQSLLRFSALLRYQLYDCGKGPVLLQNEITSLQNYIDIQKLRTGDQMEITTHFPEDIPNMHIEPFLLLPIVENAFKYAAPIPGQKPQAHIQIALTDNRLSLVSENTFEEKFPENADAKGIGLANIVRRLQILYPNQHSLTLTRKENRFRATLNIELKWTSGA